MTPAAAAAPRQLLVPVVPKVSLPVEAAPRHAELEGPVAAGEGPQSQPEGGLLVSVLAGLFRIDREKQKSLTASVVESYLSL